jgi:hypothetical protein
MLLAGEAQRSLRHADCRANFSQIERPVEIRFQEFLESRDDRMVSAASYSFTNLHDSRAFFSGSQLTLEAVSGFDHHSEYVSG